MHRVALAIVVIIGLMSVLLWSQTRPQDPRVSGFIEADEIRIGSRVGGRVAKVYVQEGDAVTRGQKLVELEPFDLQEKLQQALSSWDQKKSEHAKLVAGFRAEERAQAEARVRQLEALGNKLRNGPRPQEIAAARADLSLASAQLELAQIEFDRVTDLVSKNAARQDAADQARTQLKVTQQQVVARTEQLALLEAGTRNEDIAAAEAQLDEARAALTLVVNGSRDEDTAAAYAAMQSAEAAVNAIRKQLDELIITAPVDGMVEAVELQPGDLVSANAPVMSLLDGTRLWVRAFVPENRMDLQIGDTLRASIDSFPNEEFTVRVGFISRQAEFTPANVQTPEERSKQVFRIKAVLEGATGKLRPGMAADLWLERRP